jgi:hypothetical protein
MYIMKGITDIYLDTYTQTYKNIHTYITYIHNIHAGNFSLHHRVQNGSGAHPASSPIGTRGFFPGDKAAGA